MAYVRRTDTLMYEVINKVRDMERVALNPYDIEGIKADTPEYNELYHIVEDVVWKEAPELKGKLPDEWLEYCTYKEVRLKIPNPADPTDRNTTLTVDVKVPDGAASFKLTPQYNERDRYYGRPTASVSLDAEDVPPLTTKWFEDRAAKVEKRKEIADEYHDTANKLSAFMKAHASLNTMLEAMPAFEHYVPQSFMDRLRKPNKKRESNGVKITIAEELNIDTNKLASMAVGHRMLTAGSQ